MLNVDEVCEMFFDGKVKPKHLTSFDEVTPQGNGITGYLNQKPNKYLGSLVITSVNDEPTMQFVQSMPKIHYFNDSRDILVSDKIYFCYEKLDGSCLILYPLLNSNGEIIEIVPKTRGRAVADTHFIELYNKVDKKPIIEYYKDNTGVLIFEMYGILNQHDIIHYNTGIDIRLISVVENGVFFNNMIDYGHCTYTKIYECGFKLPYAMFELYHDGADWYIKAISQKYYPYLKDIWNS